MKISKTLKMTKIRILSTKKLTNPERIILPVGQFRLIEEDFIRIKLLNFDIVPIAIGIDLLLFTSKNAVLSILKNKNAASLKQINCICVGEKTKELLEQNGFVVLDFTHYAEDLTKVILEKYSDKRFAFFCGNLRRNVLPDFFNENQIKFHEIQVYQNQLTPRKINEEFDAVLFFSPSGVISFLEKNTLEDQVCFCIGTTTADALASYTKHVILSEKPIIASVLDKVAEFYSQLL